MHPSCAQTNGLSPVCAFLTWIAFCVACLNERPHPYGQGRGPVLYGVLMRVTTLFTILRLRRWMTRIDVARKKRSARLLSEKKVFFGSRRALTVCHARRFARRFVVDVTEEYSRAFGGERFRTHPL